MPDFDSKGNRKRQSLIIPSIVLLSTVLLVLAMHEVEILGIELVKSSFELLGVLVRGIGLLAALSVVPAFIGLLYRKTFWPWYWISFALLFVVQVSLWAKLGIVLESGTVTLGAMREELGLLVGAAAVFTAFRLRRSQAVVGSQGKNIVLCIDGTWNHPGQKDGGFVAWTNVFKIWKCLSWSGEAEERRDPRRNANLCKRYENSEGKVKQVGLYYNGVGNAAENSSLGMAFGGAFGMGAEGLKTRVYLDLVMEYNAGDRIFIFGFSRGAAIARMLASHVHKHGIPRVIWTLRALGRQRVVRTSQEKASGVSIAVLGVWDTVASFGISKNLFGLKFQKINLFKDFSVAPSVRRAYHMVALDETRDAFVPTLMNPDPITPGRISEVWFSGIHANVGGGYKTDKLSDLTLNFLLKRVSGQYGSQVPFAASGLYVDAVNGRELVDAAGDADGDEFKKKLLDAAKIDRNAVVRLLLLAAWVGREPKPESPILKPENCRRRLFEVCKISISKEHEEYWNDLFRSFLEDRVHRNVSNFMYGLSWSAGLKEIKFQAESRRELSRMDRLLAKLRLRSEESWRESLKEKEGVLQVIKGVEKLSRWCQIAASPFIVWPDPTGKVRSEAGSVYKFEPRELPEDALIHASVFQRIEREEEAQPEAGDRPDTRVGYYPESLFRLAKTVEDHRYRATRGYQRLGRISGLKQVGKVSRASEEDLSIREARPPSWHDLRAELKWVERVTADMQGRVVRVRVEEGARVVGDQSLVVLEGKKSKKEIKAESPGVVTKILVEPGQTVREGDPLLELGAS